MRIIVTALAVFSAFGLFLHAFQRQLSTTTGALPDAANASAGSHEALNASREIVGDVTVPLADLLPLAFGAAFVVMVLVMAWGVTGR